MNTLNKLFLCFFLGWSFASAGCSHIQEAGKTFWGSSTRALEEARIDAIRKTYKCRYDECFDEVLRVAKEGSLYIHIADKGREYIVLMRIPGSIDTTEVGIFFSDLGTKTRVDISSLSPSAKQIAADIIFSALNERYDEIVSVDLGA